MNQTKLLFTTLLAAAAASVPAFGVTSENKALTGSVNSTTTDNITWNYAFSGSYTTVENLDGALALMPQVDGTGDNVGNQVYPRYYVDKNVLGNLQIGEATTTVDGSVHGVAITNANGGTQTFSGAITGTGVLAVYFASNAVQNKGEANEYTGTIYNFTGDVSKFSGDFYVNVLEAGRINALKFSGTNTTAISGTGNITTNRTLTYAATSASTIANSAISAATLNFSGGATYTVNTTDLTVSETLTVESGTTVKLSAGTVSGALSGAGAIEKSGTGTLTLSGTKEGYTGEITVSGGTLRVDKSGNTGTYGTFGEGASIVVKDGGKLSSGVTLSANITVVLGDAYAGDSNAAISGTGVSSAVSIVASTALKETLVGAGAGTQLTFAIGVGKDYVSFSDNDFADWTAEEKTVSYEGYGTYGTGVYVLTKIPEPSAFGLLAGLGALALVASRRRRK